MAFAETAQLAVRIDLEGNASAGIAKLNKQVKGLGQSTGRIGKGFGQIGAGIVRAGLVVGGAAVTGLAAAGKAAIDFEDAFAGVKKTVDEADLKEVGLSFDSLRKSFLDMSAEIPITAVEFAQLGETAGALGIKAKDIEEFTRVTALMGVTTDLTADEAADAFGRIGTILGLTGDDYQELADSIVSLGNAGASVESEITEITKRFAAQAKQLGLTKEEMVALASATASLGFAPERGGTALSRVFANLATNISTANAKGTALSKGLGRSIKDLQSDIDKGKGLDIFMDVLQELKTLSPTESARFLKAIGVTNTSDRNIFQAMAQQLPFINEQLELAKTSQGALLEEANKKFATTASKLQVFKNNLIRAGITIGEQFLPAVGRALDKLTAVFKDPATQSDLAQLGKDVGAAIDSVNWDEVLSAARDFAGVLKGTLDITLKILEAINKLPTELKAAGAAFLVANKLSGGLIGSGIGNVVGGLAETVTRSIGSRAPGVGKLFAQPVFVTNWPMGGIGGGGGGAGGVVSKGAGLMSKALSVATIVSSVAAVVATQQDQSGQSTAHANEIKAGLDASIAGKSLPELKQALAGVNQGINDLQSNPLYALVQGEALTTLKQMQADLSTRIAKTEEVQAIRAIKDEVNSSSRSEKGAIKTMEDRLKSAADETKRETGRGLSIVNQSTRSGDAMVAGAIRANRPIVTTTVNVNVSAAGVSKSVVEQERYGPGNGSQGGGNAAKGHGGGG